MTEKFNNKQNSLPINNSEIKSDYRFNISPESMELFKDIRSEFLKLKENLPELSGMTFFGSRTLGREKKESDIDSVLFIETENTSSGKNPISKLSSTDIKEKVEKELNFHQKNKNSLAQLSIIWTIDTSLKETDNDFNDFKNLVKEQRRGRLGFTRENTTMPQPAAAKLVARFFLGFGEGLYKNRKYILDRLEHEKEGEIFWQKIIEYLSYIERTAKTSKRLGLLSYDNYPKTIQEAQKFFKNI